MQVLVLLASWCASVAVSLVLVRIMFGRDTRPRLEPVTGAQHVGEPAQFWRRPHPVAYGLVLSGNPLSPDTKSVKRRPTSGRPASRR
jgi:hypothetical protein